MSRYPVTLERLIDSNVVLEFKNSDIFLSREKGVVHVYPRLNDPDCSFFGGGIVKFSGTSYGNYFVKLGRKSREDNNIYEVVLVNKKTSREYKYLIYGVVVDAPENLDFMIYVSFEKYKKMLERAQKVK